MALCVKTFEKKKLKFKKLLQINNVSLEGMKSVSEAMALLNECQYESVALTLLRPLYTCCNNARER